MKKTTAVLAALAFLLMAVVAVAAVPGKVEIKQAVAKQGPVAFDHAKHTERVKTCDNCHHTQKGLTKETKGEVKACAACHLNAKDKVPSARDMSMTKNPYHIKCIGCHKAEKKGPTACNGCHAKK